jgi:hypothetical protein
MTYDVLKDFEDPGFLVQDDSDEQKKVPLKLSAGAKFIPASIHYPADRIAARVSEGVLKLIDPHPVKPHHGSAAAPKKK